jgi:hypothetical protein
MQTDERLTTPDIGLIRTAPVGQQASCANVKEPGNTNKSVRIARRLSQSRAKVAVRRDPDVEAESVHARRQLLRQQTRDNQRWLLLCAYALTEGE